MRKPTFWFQTWSDTNQAVQLQKMAGSGSTRPGTNTAPESTRPRVNSAGSTRPVNFPYGESGYHINYVPNNKFGRYDLESAR